MYRYTHTQIHKYILHFANDKINHISRILCILSPHLFLISIPISQYISLSIWNTYKYID